MSFAEEVKEARNAGASAQELSTAALLSIATSLETLASEADETQALTDEVSQDDFTRDLFQIMRAATSNGKDGLPVDIVAANLLARYEIRPRFVPDVLEVPIALGANGG